jgi:hypothetical protein
MSISRRKFASVLGLGAAASAVPVVACAAYMATPAPKLELPRFRYGDMIRCEDFNRAFEEIEKRLNERNS